MDEMEKKRRTKNAIKLYQLKFQKSDRNRDRQKDRNTDRYLGILADLNDKDGRIRKTD